jgi:hypothetical protein
MLEALKIIGSILGIIAFGWKISDLFAAYLHIRLDLKTQKKVIFAKVTVENKGSLKKRIDNALLLIGPEDENPIETFNQLATTSEISVNATCTNDIAACHVSKK